MKTLCCTSSNVIHICRFSKDKFRLSENTKRRIANRQENRSRSLYCFDCRISKFACWPQLRTSSNFVRAKMFKVSLECDAGFDSQWNVLKQTLRHKSNKNFWNIEVRKKTEM